MNVLVADDEIHVRKLICSIISANFDKKFNIFQAGSYDAAIKIISQINIDILITDIKIEGSNGIELAQNMRKNSPRCGLIFISAYDDKTYLKAAISLGADAYIEKPISEKELADAISKFSAGSTPKQKPNPLGNNTDELNLVDTLIGKNINDLNFTAAILKYLPNYVNKNPDTAIEQKIKILSTGKANLFYTKKYAGTYVFIYIFSNSDEKYIDVFSNIATEINKITNAVLSIGSVVKEYCQIINSYDEAAITIERAFFEESKIFLKIDDVQDCLKDIKFDVFKSIQYFDRLIKKYDKKEVLDYIDEVYDKLLMSKSLPSGLVVFLFKQYIYHTYIAFSGKDFSDTEQDNKVLDSMEFLRFRDLYIYAVNEISRCFSDVKNKGIISDIKIYIDENYSNSDLSIGEICEKFHLSASNICTKFKKATNSTINGYITSTRMEHAKALLIQNAYSSEQIAEMIGYKDPNYFSRNFKKFYGITVSEYKKDYG